MPTTKAARRRAALAARQALGLADVAQRSELLQRQLFAHFGVAGWQWLHLFLPLVARHEPDTWLVARRVWAEQLPTRLAVPVVQPGGATLRHYELTPRTLLQPNRWGIDEPVPDPLTAPEVFPEQLDAVLVPLLYCDQRGHRVGYGGGFYDRFLAQCRPGTAFIGLNVLNEPPGPPIADVLPTDVPLTAYITPDGVWNFS
ncbi:5-formyltetrahydrofolate cyclo-ligase [Hymenobacter sp. RP-2-7]|uniref:5-formyltetrahydrofolate cyclo-ligase n=1 Tax=Hymenobacter polaris TaxID=2682546 RepID=A0A7Y0AGL1_9BACT|nr:5-formyltetrahydrofolate cyclo-ligase [Hymenobacter polaris]NML66983.1 5-formyltetrahydrofolate cyclo-ligase [Hymenobacter polaris]